jgi:hypothetical protein
MQNEDMQCGYKRAIEARSRNNCCRGKAVSTVELGYKVIKGTEYFVSL